MVGKGREGKRKRFQGSFGAYTFSNMQLTASALLNFPALVEGTVPQTNSEWLISFLKIHMHGSFVKCELER